MTRFIEFNTADFRENQAESLIASIEKTTGCKVPDGIDPVTRLNNLLKDPRMAGRILEMGLRRQLNQAALDIINSKMICGQAMELNPQDLRLILEVVYPDQIPKRLTTIIGRYFKNAFSGFRDRMNKDRLQKYAESKIHHLYGPTDIKYEKNELLVLCVVRNGSRYIKDFIDHYFALGAKHIVFLDNRSDDDTVSIASRYDHVTVLSLDVPLTNDYYVARDVFFRQYLVNKFCSQRWCLLVDMDEFFDYPFSDQIKLPRLLEYLNTHNFTAVSAQMLDMFSANPITASISEKPVRIKDEYRYYDISGISKEDYLTDYFLLNKNRVSNPDIKFYVGGIRKKVFGTENWLTKHPLILSSAVDIIHPHCVSHAHCADFTTVLFHYKFTAGFMKCAEEYSHQEYAIFPEYKAIVSAYQKNPGLILKQDTSQELRSTNDLIENGFLLVSEQYKDLIR